VIRRNFLSKHSSELKWLAGTTRCKNLDETDFDDTETKVRNRNGRRPIESPARPFSNLPKAAPASDRGKIQMSSTGHAVPIPMHARQQREGIFPSSSAFVVWLSIVFRRSSGSSRRAGGRKLWIWAGIGVFRKQLNKPKFVKGGLFSKFMKIAPCHPCSYCAWVARWTLFSAEHKPEDPNAILKTFDQFCSDNPYPYCSMSG
jgi:hypothetical protein